MRFWGLIAIAVLLWLLSRLLWRAIKRDSRLDVEDGWDEAKK